jgi:hypothetical protein
MHTSKQMTKAQRHKLLRTMRQESIRFIGEPTPVDEILPLVDQIMEIVNTEMKGLKARNPKVRERAEKRVMEIGSFFISVMECLHPTYLRTLWKIEHMMDGVGAK